MINYGISWRTRDGGHVEIMGRDGVPLETIKDYARKHCGYPGHRGEWWMYLRDDIRECWHRLCAG